MGTCRHQKLVLVNINKDKLRCKHCHLTINSDELDADYCPECWEAEGIKRGNFEKVEQKAPDSGTYRCEECGEEIKTK